MEVEDELGAEGAVGEKKKKKDKKKKDKKKKDKKKKHKHRDRDREVHSSGSSDTRKLTKSVRR